MKKTFLSLSLAALVAIGCEPAKKQESATTSKKAPVFTLAWSEYPSWSVFGVAADAGLIDGEEGKQGELERKWNVDVVLKGVDYDTCIQFYGSSEADAVCITNMDILGPAADRPSVAILPTSTSVGADACIAVGIDSLDALKGQPTKGLERSVSQYAFERILVKRGLNPKDFPFVHMDPGAAATAVQTGSSDTKSIMVWNPFVLDTLRKVKTSKKLFDSSEIPEEIIDMVVVAKDSLKKEGGNRFARCILDTFYAMNERMSKPETADKTLVAIGAKFSNLNLEDMKEVVQQTKFYKTPADALELLKGEQFRSTTMPAVAAFCVEHGIVKAKPSMSFDGGEAQLSFDLSHLQSLVDGKSPQ